MWSMLLFSNSPYFKQVLDNTKFIDNTVYNIKWL